MLEEQYAKNLLKLAKSSPFPNDIGPLEESWRILIRQVESSSAAHSESARRIGEEAQKVAQTAKNQFLATYTWKKRAEHICADVKTLLNSRAK